MPEIATRTACFALSDHALIHIQGPDAEKLLQGQLTIDVKALQPGQGQLAAHCQAQGRIISLFVLFRTHDGFILCLPETMQSIALTALKKYAVFYKTSLKLAPHHYSVTANTHTSQVNNQALATVTLANGITYHLHDQPIESDQHDALAFYYQALILSHTPCITPEISGLFLPHDVNLIALGAVSFTKGCFTGQEIIARMQYKGAAKKHAIAATINNTVTLNDDVFLKEKSQAVGRVVNVLPLNPQTHLVLLSVDKSVSPNNLVTKNQTPYHSLTKNEQTHD